MRVKTLIKLLERLDPETIISREISEIEVTNTFLEGHAEEITLPMDCPYRTLPELIEHASPEDVTKYLKKSTLTFYACDRNKISLQSFSAKHFVNFYDPEMKNVVCDNAHKQMIKDSLFKEYVPKLREYILNNNEKAIDKLKDESPFFEMYFDEIKNMTLQKT